MKHDVESPLTYLPRSSVLEFRRGQVIYCPEQPPAALYLVTDGSVKISRLARDGNPVCVDVYQRDDLFGESACVALPANGEQATALATTRLMTWTPAQIEDVIARSPLLARALMRMVIERNSDFSERIEGFVADEVPQRLARCLIRFGDRLGTQQAKGSIVMMPLTHGLIAQYVGTTRELVTRHMVQFRRDGYVQYSRQGMTVYLDALRAWLRPERVNTARLRRATSYAERSCSADRGQSVTV